MLTRPTCRAPDPFRAIRAAGRVPPGPAAVRAPLLSLCPSLPVSARLCPSLPVSACCCLSLIHTHTHTYIYIYIYKYITLTPHHHRHFFCTYIYIRYDGPTLDLPHMWDSATEVGGTSSDAEMEAQVRLFTYIYIYVCVCVCVSVYVYSNLLTPSPYMCMTTSFPPLRRLWACGMTSTTTAA